MTKTADLDSGSAEKKNAPSEAGTGTSTMWYIEGGEFNIDRTNENNLIDVSVKLVDYEYDASAAGSGEARIRFHFVPFNLHKDSDIVTATTFYLKLDEDATAGYA